MCLLSMQIVLSFTYHLDPSQFTEGNKLDTFPIVELFKKIEDVSGDEMCFFLITHIFSHSTDTLNYRQLLNRYRPISD